MNTAYTHQWREPWAQSKRKRAMASADTADDGREARAMGWRTFRTVAPGEGPGDGEIMCPNETHGVQCADCGLCSGAGPQKSIVITAHGGPSKVSKVLKVIGGA